MISTRNRVVALEPITENIAETERKGGLNVLSHKVSVVASKAVYSCPELRISTGDTVYINGDSISKMDWYKKVYEIEGRKFILAPIEAVWLVKELM